MADMAHDLAPEEDEDGIDGPWERAMDRAIRDDRAPRRVVREQRIVYRVPGGRSRFTASAAYREAARVAIREACHCAVDGDGWNEPVTSEVCRFHHDRAYYTLVRERLARWLRWADTHNKG